MEVHKHWKQAKNYKQIAPLTQWSKPESGETNGPSNIERRCECYGHVGVNYSCYRSLVHLYVGYR